MNSAARVILLAGGGLAIYAAYKNRAQIGATLGPVISLLPPVDPSTLAPVCRDGEGTVIPCGTTDAVSTPEPVNVSPGAPIPPVVISPPPGSGPRGIRNNNPGNIVYNAANNWQGQTGSDGHFSIFSGMNYGIRAMFIILKNYLARGINTPATIAATWAPSGDNNNVPAYTSTLVAVSGIPANGIVGNDFLSLSKIVRGIITAENGPAYGNSLIASTPSLFIAWVMS